MCGSTLPGMHLGNNIFGISAGQSKFVNHEGMPVYQRPFMKGSLYIQFQVDFPESGTLDAEQRKSLKAILPLKAATKLTDKDLDECEETTLYDVNMEDEMGRKQQQQRAEAYEEDEDMGGQRVQCSQQ